MQKKKRQGLYLLSFDTTEDAGNKFPTGRMEVISNGMEFHNRKNTQTDGL